MSEVVEGVIVGEGSVLSMGMYIGQSTKIVIEELEKLLMEKFLLILLLYLDHYQIKIMLLHHRFIVR